MSRKITVNALDCFFTSTGCFLKDGRLTPGYAAAKVEGELFGGAISVSYSPVSHLFYACKDGETYTSGTGDYFVKICDFGSENAFLMEDYSGHIPQSIFVIGDCALIHTGTAHYAAHMNVALSCGVMHCGRVFGADANCGCLLRWSGKGGVEDWEESLNGSGYLCLDVRRGKILNILPFGKQLVLVRENGLTLLDMQSEPEKFSVSFKDIGCSTVIKNTACDVLGKLYFFTQTGLKVFDGNKISSVRFRHEEEVILPHFCIAYDNKYFIACKSAFKDCDAIVCIDLDSGESCLIEERADFFFFNDGVTFTSATQFKKIVRADEFAFETKEIDFGTGREKTVSEIFTDGVSDVEIICGERQRKFTAASGLLRPKIRGKNFKVRVVGSGKISRLQLTAEVLDAI